jgi:hypothetical protein
MLNSKPLEVILMPIAPLKSGLTIAAKIVTRVRKITVFARLPVDGKTLLKI